MPDMEFRSDTATRGEWGSEGKSTRVTQSAPESESEDLKDLAGSSSTFSSLLRFFLSLSLSYFFFSLSVLPVSSTSREGASVRPTRNENEEEDGEKLEKEKIVRGTRSGEGIGKSRKISGFSLGEDVRGRETRMRRGTCTHRGSRMRSPSSTGGCSTFFSVTGRRCAGHRRRDYRLLTPRRIQLATTAVCATRVGPHSLVAACSHNVAVDRPRD